jgi:aromatic ring-opening dioxygenase LigB subunit
MPLLGVLLLAVLTTIKAVSGHVVGALIIPHGDFSFDPTLLPEGTASRQAAEEVSSAARKAGQWVHDLHPDVIFLSSPHGQELSNDFAVYLNSEGNGFVNLGTDLHNGTSYRALLPTTDLSPILSSDLISFLAHGNVTGILNFADSEPSPLRWAEVVPMLMIPHNQSRLMIWSHPLRRYNKSVEMIPELLGLGRDIFDWMEAQPERFAVVISADLSHTHLADGPYGYSPASAKFDAFVGEWMRDPLGSSGSLLRKAAQLQPKALSCGFTGLVLLHGLLERAGGDAFEPKVLANRNATYYGMCVSTYLRLPHQRTQIIRNRRFSSMKQT